MTAPRPTSRLSDTPQGTTVRISHLDGDVDATVVRLMEMGLIPGADIRVTRRAPLGDPLEIHVKDTRVCLRRADARRFVVDAEAR